jgi:hypothetical protein
MADTDSMLAHSTTRPTSVDEFLRCLIWPGWNPTVAFYEGSRKCLNLKADLVRDSLKALQKRADLSRYTHALGKIVRLSQPDEHLRAEWRLNLPLLRALFYTSPSGTKRQQIKLLEIAHNARVVSAMRYALRQEKEIQPREIEPSWIAVLYAEGSKASVQAAERYNSLLKPETQATLRTYRRNTSS